MAKDMNMIGKRIRVHSLVGEPKQVNDRYAGREGVIGHIDDIGQYHIIWDGATEIGGLAVIPGEDDYEILESAQENNNSKELLEAKGLTPEEKMERWHLGTRKENIKACSDEKLVEYRKICRAKGYTEQVKLINAEIKSRKSDKSKPVNEAFENNRLTNLIADHGGLDKRQRRWDARTYATDVDISRSTVSGFIPARAMDYIYMLDPSEPIYKQILHCNDGGAIVLRHEYEGYDSPYTKKVQDRNWNAFKDFELENGKKHTWQGMHSMSKWVTQARRLREPLKEGEELNESINYGNLTSIGQRAMDDAVSHLRAAFEDFSTIMFRGGMDDDNEDFQEMQELKDKLGTILDKLPW